jgi:type VI secretion system protein VasD
VVRLYQLQATDAFTRADFFALYEREAAVLGADLVTREELLLRPGETRPLDRTLAADTRHLGVLVAYRDLDRTVWRTVLATTPQRTTVVTLAVQRSAVQVLPR